MNAPQNDTNAINAIIRDRYGVALRVSLKGGHIAYEAIQKSGAAVVGLLWDGKARTDEEVVQWLADTFDLKPLEP